MSYKNNLPYGYRMIQGRVEIQEEEAERLRTYFRRFLDGETMAEAARFAGLPLSSSNLRFLLYQKAYAGTEHFPAIISQEERDRLMSERVRRQIERKNLSRRQPAKYVQVHTHFELMEIPLEKKNMSAQDCANHLYNRIRAVEPGTSES